MPPAPALTRPYNLFSNLTAPPHNIFAREASVKDISYISDTRRAIAISLGILFGIAAPILILAIIYCVYKRRNLSENKPSPPRPGSENCSDFVVIVPGAEKAVPFPHTAHHPDSRDGHVDDREGRCGVFCIACCGSTRERSEGQKKKRRRRHNGRPIGAYGSGGSVDDRTHRQPRYQGTSTYMDATTDERISRVSHRRETPGRRHKAKGHRRPTGSQGSSLETVSARKADKKGNNIGRSEAVHYQSRGIQAPRPCVPRQRTRPPPGGSPVQTRRIQQNPQDPDKLQVPNQNTGRHQPRKSSRRRSPPSRPPSQGSNSGISYPHRIYDPRYHNQPNASIPQLPREEGCEHEDKDGEGVHICCPSSSSTHPSGPVTPPSFIHIEVGANLPEEVANTISSGRNSSVSHLDSVNGTSTTGGRGVPMANGYIGHDGEEGPQATLAEASSQPSWRSIESRIELEHPGLLVDFSRRSQGYSSSRSDIVTETGDWKFREIVCDFPIGADLSPSSATKTVRTNSQSKETWDSDSNIPGHYGELGSYKTSSGLDPSDSDWPRTNPNNASSVSTVIHAPQSVTDSHSSIPPSRMYVSRIHTPPSASDAQNWSSAASISNSGQSFSSTGYLSAPGSASQSSIGRLPASYEYFLAPTYPRLPQSRASGVFPTPSPPQSDYLVITASPSPSVLSDPKATIRESSPTPSESVSTTNPRRHTDFIPAPSSVYCDNTSSPTPNSHSSYVASLVGTIDPSEALTGGSQPASRPPSRETRENSDRYVPMPQITITHESRVYTVPPVVTPSRRQDIRVTERQEVEEGIVEATNSTGDERPGALEGEGAPVPIVLPAKSRYQATAESVVDDSDGTGGVGFARDI